MFGWFHCGAVHSLSLSMDMPIWSNLLVPPFVLPQFHHFKAELVLGTVRTGHLRYHSRCRACTDALCMSDEVWLHRLGAGDVMSHLPYFNVSDRLVAVLLCGKLVPVWFLGYETTGGAWSQSRLEALATLAACTWPRLGFCTHDCIKFWGNFNWCLQAAVRCCGYFSISLIVLPVVMGCVIQIDGRTNEHWHGIIRPLYLVYAAGGALLFSGLFHSGKKKCCLVRC